MKHLSKTVKTVFTLTIFASVAFLGFYWSSTISANNKQSNLKTNSMPLTGQPANDYADLIVKVGDAIDGSGNFTTATISHEVVINGTKYPAVVPSNTRRQVSKKNIPIRGTLSNGVVTLDEAPFGIIDPSNYETEGVNETMVGEHGVASKIGGEVEYFQDPMSFNSRLAQQLKWESQIGPDEPSAPLGETELASPWTEGVKTFLFIVVDFSDQPGTPGGPAGQMTQANVSNLMNNSVSPFFVANSYSKTSIQTTVTTVLRLPNPRTYYQNNSGQLLTDARAVAETAGWDTDNFDLDTVAGDLPNVCGVNAAGCAFLGAKGMWIAQSGFSGGVLSHELGHNYGLHHASQWVSNDGTPIGPGGNIEYGDLYDVMGNTTFAFPANHFNSSSKRALDWLTDSNVRTVKSDATFRILSQDVSPDGGIRGIKVRKDAEKDYWVSHRELTDNPNMDGGVQFHWKFPGFNNTGLYTISQLLDMNTPGSTLFDSPLNAGQNFLDSGIRTRFTAIDGGELPGAINVKLEFNVGCTFSLAQSSASFAASGGSGEIPVNTQSECVPPSTDNSTWIHVVESKKGSSQATVRYVVLPNYGAARSGTITVAGQTFTVSQSAVATACVSSPSGQVAWWRGDGNALDQTGKNGGVVRELNNSFGAGKLGGAFRTLDMSENSNDLIAFVPDSPSLTLTNSLTIEGWLRLNDYVSALHGSVVRRSNKGFFLPASYAIDFVDGYPRFIINSNPDGSSYAFVLGSQLPLGEYVHFAGTLDHATGSMKIYINGQVIEQITTSLRPYQTLPGGGNGGGGILIGDSSGTVDYSMDELGVYNRALSASEVQSIYNAGVASGGAAGKCPISPVDKTPFDFDGDRRSDLSVFTKQTAQTWLIYGSQTGFSETQFGLSTDILAPADYDNDGKTDIGVYRDGTWYIQQSSAGFVGVQWGLPGDIPQPADFTGDGKAEATVFRPSNGTWYALNLVNAQYTAFQWGLSTDKPVVGDYDGDRVADYAVFRPSNGIWYLQQSSAGFAGPQFGVSTDKTVPGDYDGDGKTDVAVARESDGYWYVLRSTDAGVTYIPLGIASGYPSPFDYDGDGKTDAAVWRPGSGMKKGEWSIIQSHTNQLKLEYWGDRRDVSVPNVFVF